MMVAQELFLSNRYIHKTYYYRKQEILVMAEWFPLSGGTQKINSLHL